MGLPGCGKTTYLNELERDSWSAFDDFKANALDDSPLFRNSRHFESLLAALRNGRRSVVADIDFCRRDSRAEAESDLRAAVPDLEIEWCFFENDERACAENIRRRNRDRLETDLRKLREYSCVYSIPTEAGVRPVAGRNA